MAAAPPAGGGGGKSVGAQLRESAQLAIGMIIGIGAVATGLFILYFMGYKINETSGVNILGFFKPVTDNWPTLSNIFLIGVAMVVVIPIITWMVQSFRSQTV